jgi:hypothetical protein
MLRNFGRGYRPLGPLFIRSLNTAFRLLQGGKPGEAAGLFAQLAGQMEATNHPRQAANLHANASHAFTDAHAAVGALEHARAALNLFLEYNMSNRAARFYQNITRKLDANGMMAEVGQLNQEFADRIAQLPVTGPAGVPAPHKALPAHCPNCGAPIRSDEAEWVDSMTAECGYCESMVHATG